ncbi:hypothetical protein I7I48_08060 [Histoplasma ohiense]|nr:hypothetical protein I7I48_08060 [Histoplasma ohiense (nom. inval.)]
MDYGRYIADWNRLDAVLGTVAGEEANSRGVWYWIGSQRRFTAEMGKRKASNVWLFLPEECGLRNTRPFTQHGVSTTTQ